jgi:hypothetical protein
MPIYNAVQDNSSVTRLMAKKHLRIDESDTYTDDILDLIILAAKQAADTYCQDTFTSYTVDASVSIPAEVDLWILQIISLHWERKNPFITSMEYKDLGSQDWEFNYDDYFHLLKPYRREVGFGPF